MKKRALITGITGQDGAYLADLLLEKDYEIYGTYRRLSTPNFWRLQYLGIFDKIKLIPSDMIDSSSLFDAISIVKPDEIYNLAAQSFVGASFEQAVSSGEITGLGYTRLLEGVRKICPQTKVYQASTSELYGDNTFLEQNENTPFKPSSPYASAKLYAHSISQVYKEAYGLFISNGILFNHESPIRGLEFVTRKITNSVAKISLGIENELVLGNLESKRDWGYAKDFVKAMWLILQQEKPDNYVIATNEVHSVKDFVDECFSIVGLDPSNYVKINDKFKRPSDVNYLCGDYTKAKKQLGWEPSVRFKELVSIMLNEDVKRWKDWLDGKHFPWDANNYPNERLLQSRLYKIDK